MILNLCPSLRPLVNSRIKLVSSASKFILTMEVPVIFLGYCLSAPSPHLFFSFLGPGNFCLVHVSLVPVLSAVGEQVIVYGIDIFHGGSMLLICNSGEI